MDYRYKAIVKRVIDGDTIVVDWDLGKQIWVRGEKLRLLRINAPEITSSEKEEGLKAKAALEEKLPVGTEIEILTMKFEVESFHRYLAEVFLNGENINEWMVKNGFAIYKDY